MKLTRLSALPVEVRLAADGRLRLRPQSTFKSTVVLEHQGDRAIKWSASNPLHLTYRWLDQAGNIVERDGLRTVLPVEALQPRSSVEVEMVGLAPADLGDYVLQPSLVLEGVEWACDVGPSGWSQAEVEVAAEPGWPNQLGASSAARALRGAMVAAELGRQLNPESFRLAVPAAAQDPEAPAPVALAPAQPSELQPPSSSVGRRIRNWLRDVLGMAGLEQQVAKALEVADRQSEQIAQLEPQIAALRTELMTALDAAGHRAARMAEGVTDVRHEMIVQFGSLEKALREQGDDQAIKGVQIFKAVTKLVATLRTELMTGLDVVGHRAERIAEGVTDVRHEMIAQFGSLEKALRGQGDDQAIKGDQIVRAVTQARDELARSLDANKLAFKEQTRKIAQVDSALRKLAEFEALAATNAELGSRETMTAIADSRATILAASEVQEQLLRDVQVKLGSQAAQMARLAEPPAELALLPAMPPRLEAMSNAQNELLERVSALDASHRDVSWQLRHGSVVVELIAGIRQLIGLAAASDDSQALARITHMVEGMIEHSGERDQSDDAGRDKLDWHIVQNSVKLDALLTRQAIPLAGDGLVLVRNRFGLLAIQDDDARAIAYYSSGELPEPGTVALVDQLLKPGDCFVDVGANVGIYSLIAGRRVGPDGSVIAIEPSPSTMRALRMTVAINGISSLTQTHECALGSADGTATLHCEATSGHSSLVGPTESTRSTVEVPVKNGDSLFGTIRPALIKIDVEGWEPDVVKGLEKLIKRSRKLCLIVEFSPDHIRRRGIEPTEWFEAIRALGFDCWQISDQDITLRSLTTIDGVQSGGANLLFCRSLPAELKPMANVA